MVVDVVPLGFQVKSKPKGCMAELTCAQHENSLAGPVAEIAMRLARARFPVDEPVDEPSESASRPPPRFPARSARYRAAGSSFSFVFGPSSSSAARAHTFTTVAVRPRAHGSFLAGEVGELAGVSGTTIGQWARRGLIRSSQCIPDLLQPRDIAEIALFLASDASAALTGQEILADRGWAYS